MRIPGSLAILRTLALGGVLLSTSAVQADEPKKSGDVFTDLGVVLEKTRYVFADDEQALVDKYQDAKAARDQARMAMGKIEESAMIEQGIYELQAEEQQIQAEIGAIRANSNRMGSGRRRGGSYYRNQANAMIRQEEAVRNQIKSQIAQANKQKPTDKQKQSNQLAARGAMERANQAVRDVNDAYDALVERYDQARDKPGLIKALEEAGRAKKVSLRLGPSEEAEKIGKWAKGILKIRTRKPVHKPAADAKSTSGAAAAPKSE